MNELRKLSQKEIAKKIEETNTKLNSLRYDIAAGDLANLNEYRKLKKEFARSLTVLKELELGIKREIKETLIKSKTKVAKKSESKLETKTKKKVKKTVSSTKK